MTTITTTDTTPRVWISSFGAYNEGYLIGKWVDAIDAADVTPQELFEGTPYRWTDDEELWCFDIENIPLRREMSPHEAAEWGRVFGEVDEHQRDALYAWVASGDYVAEGTGELPCTSDFEDRYCGRWDSFDDYASNYADDTGLLTGIPEEIQRHFDWESWTRELADDYSVVSASERFGHGVFVFRSC